MTYKELAYKLDREEKLIEAADAYEKAIIDPDADLELLINLAVLYFVCTDGGYLSSYHLSNEFVDHAWERATHLLDEAEARFGRDAEIDFWRRYFQFIRLGEDESIMEKEQLRSSKSLIPYFYLFKAGDGEEYRAQAEKLHQLVADKSSAKKRYIKSVLESNIEPKL
ncbi:MAG TPA: hypothetical protein VJ302_05690 [Blastocatellia bacterium]|nr:hypothetical protein [Blastocatellia bacterium]